MFIMTQHMYATKQMPPQPRPDQGHTTQGDGNQGTQTSGLSERVGWGPASRTDEERDHSEHKPRQTTTEPHSQQYIPNDDRHLNEDDRQHGCGAIVRIAAGGHGA